MIDFAQHVSTDNAAPVPTSKIPTQAKRRPAPPAEASASTGPADGSSRMCHPH
jgi:hypothetical protein